MEPIHGRDIMTMFASLVGGFNEFLALRVIGGIFEAFSA